MIIFIFIFIVHQLFLNHQIQLKCSIKTQNQQRLSRGSWWGSYRTTSSSRKWWVWQKWTQAASHRRCSHASSPRRRRTSLSCPRSQSTRSTGCTPSSRPSTPRSTLASKSAPTSWTPSKAGLSLCPRSAHMQVPPRERRQRPSLSLLLQKRLSLSPNKKKVLWIKNNSMDVY